MKSIIPGLLTGVFAEPIIALSPTKCIWFTWTGTKIQRTLRLLADSAGLSCTDREIAIEFQASMQEVVQRMRQTASKNIDAESLAARLPAKQTRKLDYLVDVPLLIKSLTHDALDISGAIQLIQSELQHDT